MSATIDNRDDLVISSDPEHPANLICELCRDFYKLGWVTGTGGGELISLIKMGLSDRIGISVRHGEHVYLAPSGVQKERIKPEHIFVLPFAQSSVPKPGSQRDFLRIPTQAVCLAMSKRNAKLMYRASRSQHVPLCSGTHSPCVTLGPVFTHTLSTLASPSLFWSYTC
jgi:hypothetical protein